jgi:LacI family transcriptional regulator
VTKRSSTPTVADVARLAGVGAITVSRVVNGTSYVSVEKQKKIHAAINRLGYRPNQAARILKGQRARMIGLIVPDLSDPFFGMCASAVENFAFERGYMTLIVASQRNQEFERNEVEIMMGQNIAGLVIVPSLPNERLKQLAASGVPIVALDRPLPEVTADEVVVENLGGAEMAVSHLLGHGHKKIACIGYDKNFYSISHRILGYTNAMRASGLKCDIYDCASTFKSINKIVRSWKRSASPPTAIFSLNNVTTSHVLQALQREGFAIPHQMAVVGFDDFALASLLSPPLTAVRQPATSLGTQAARLLFDRIGMEPITTGLSGIKLVLPVEFIVRGSCGCSVTATPRRRLSESGPDLVLQDERPV